MPILVKSGVGSFPSFILCNGDRLQYFGRMLDPIQNHSIIFPEPY